MNNTRNISKDIIWVGGNDRRLALFENLFPLREGISYNSYIILDEKTALMDTVDNSISQLFLENIEEALGGRDLDYMVVQHMEPDHCSNIEAIIRRYPNIKFVGNKTTFKFFEQFYPNDSFESHYYLVKESDELSLGKHNLKFIMAPSVHWPEVMVSYDETSKILFSADAFGSFNPIDGNLFTDEIDFRPRMEYESRRYYSNIVGKFGINVQRLLDKLSNLEIDMILSLHGPLYRTQEHIVFIVSRYQKWAAFEPETQGVVMCVGSMYGNTQNAAEKLATMLADKGVKNIKIHDISRTDPSDCIADMWQYSNIVFAAPNYNGDLFYKAENLMNEANRLNLKNRKVSFISNKTWGGVAIKTMLAHFDDPKNFEIVGDQVILDSSLKQVNVDQLEALADSIVQSLK